MGEALIFTVGLASGDFKSELRLPLPTTPAEHKQVVERWLDFMATGLRVSATEMSAAISLKTEGERK